MTKVGILDDEVLICETLSKYLKELGYDVPDYAVSFDEGIELLKNHQPDIMLLDININGPLSGIDFALHIREHYHIPLIFISSYSDKTTIDTAQTAKPNGYLIKPFTKEDLYSSIETAVSSFSSPFIHKDDGSHKYASDAIFIKQNSVYEKVPTNSILYIKSDGVYIEIHTTEKKLLVRETLKKMTEILPGEHFIQVHRSYIINIHHVTALNSEFIITDNHSIPISKSMKDSLMEKLHLL